MPKGVGIDTLFHFESDSYAQAMYNLEYYFDFRYPFLTARALLIASVSSLNALDDFYNTSHKWLFGML